MSNVFNWDLGSLSPTQKNIADFIEKNADRLPYLTESDIAAEVPTSIASVSRFWQAVGYANLKDFKHSIRESETITPAKKMKNMFNKIAADDLLCDMLERTAEYLQDTSYNLAREQFDLAVDKMVEAKTIYVFAPGPSEGLGALLQFRLNRFGVRVQTLPQSGHLLFESLVNFTPDDVVVVFSFFKILPETKVILDYAAELPCASIVITDRLVSDLNIQADVVLYTCRGQLWEFHSMVAPTAVVESLVIAIGLRIEHRALANLERLQALRKKYAHVIPK
ncbi:MurR/RpiR family transcriptional regulator [Paenibacillus filicis]|uniref:MurR/RpiR family transcriptional regulator n=1 Tax=Paenibacillus gyeongsangnamensis TaxID=3388067 RepID=A0ABT4QC99_9BACL|nr:MurR/RpiR family transcriptional regulator [Paenibacillus filicis]MCZ8514401.1 MurR/RpiR family transcriptional regulator [Paenibacillus filicis]